MEEHKLRVSEDEEGLWATGRASNGGWRKLRDEELRNLCYSADIKVIKSRMRWTGHVARMRHQICVRNFGRKT